jgi:Mn-dependent DtxR family transcriptional regulator
VADDLSKSQMRLLKTISKLTRKEGVPPSLSEIAEALDITKPTAQSQIRRLRELGRILPSNGKYRNIRVA